MRQLFNPRGFLATSILGICITGSIAYIEYDISRESDHRANRSFISVITVSLTLYSVVIAVSGYLALLNTAAFSFDLLSLPRASISFRQGDLPRDSAELVSREHARTCAIHTHAKPKDRKLLGWGTGPYKSMNFRQSIIETSAILIHMVDSVQDSKESRGLVQHGRLSSLQPLSRLFSPQSPVKGISHKYLPIAQRYEKHLSRAYMLYEEPDEAAYEEVVRITALFTKLILVHTGRLPADHVPL